MCVCNQSASWGVTLGCHAGVSRGGASSRQQRGKQLANLACTVHGADECSLELSMHTVTVTGCSYSYRMKLQLQDAVTGTGCSYRYRSELTKDTK